jgi:hypothetical protein
MLASSAIRTQAEAFAADTELHSAMAHAGVVGDPGIEIFEDIA